MFPHLSLGVEALYKPLHYDEAASYRNGVVIGFAPATVVTWQFPVLAKYKFPLRRVKPFLEAGPSFRAAGNLNSSNPSHFGVSAGVGAEAQWRRLNIAPRLRYTRWAKDPWFADVPTRADQLELLVGIGYNATSDAHPLGRRISLGVVLALPVSDEFRPATMYVADPLTGKPATVQIFSGPRRPALGPQVELRISPRFSVEANAISRCVRATGKVLEPGSNMDPRSYYNPCGHSAVEVPVLPKYRLTAGSLRPFLALGPSFRLPKEVGGAWLSTYGVTTGAGVEFQWKRLKIAPSARFTRWGPERPRFAGGEANSGMFRNQMQVLLGVAF